MKVYIGKYVNFFGPYQLAEKLCFWVRPVRDEYGILNKPGWVHEFGEWLAHGSIEPEPTVGEPMSFSRERHKTLLYKALSWIDSKKSRKVNIKIHNYDVWSADTTLALIILPMLKRIKVDKHGSPYVVDEDVLEHIRSTSAPPKKYEYDVDDNHHARWEYVLDEMIFAFEHLLDDSWEDQFTTGVVDQHTVKREDGNYELVAGANHTYNVDYEAKKLYAARIQQGFTFFGKYFQSLWT